MRVLYILGYFNKHLLLQPKTLLVYKYILIFYHKIVFFAYGNNEYLLRCVRAKETEFDGTMKKA